jgi:Prealbumin-like fold domain
MRLFARSRTEPGPLTDEGGPRRSGRAKIGIGLTTILVLVAAGLLLAVTSGAAILGTGGGSPTITSDLPDYNPGGTVTLTGSSWDSGGAKVHIVVNDDVGQTWQHVADVTPDSNGAITDVFQLPNYFVAQYSVQATQQTDSGTLTASSSFTDANPSANLDQCANDPAPSPSSDGCETSAGWVNGNVNGSKANYFEGDSLPYRMAMDNLSLGSHTITIEWDTTQGGQHALDYITSFDRTVSTANPCAGISCGSPTTTFPIPLDPNVSGAGVTQLGGQNLTLFGGTITAVSGYTLSGSYAGNSSTRITVTFTAATANPVLAWAGHIASHQDWGSGNAAANISGSPFHTRLVDLDGSGGNQDRALSSDAVVFPASITIVKDAQPDGSTSFPFTASPSPLSNFSLVDDGTSANTKAFSNITNFQTYTVQETPIPTGWALTSIVCSVTSLNGGSSTTNVGTATTTINLKEGENRTCTYTDVLQKVTLTVIKHVINDNGGTKTAGDFTMGVTGGNPSPASFAGEESPGTSVSIDASTGYSVSEGAVAGYTQTSASSGCSSATGIAPGGSATCTITNDDNAPALHLRKVVVNDNGGTKTVADFTLTADGSGSNDLSGTSPVDSGAGLKADTFALSETSVAGYTASAWDCVGGSQSGSNISVGLGQSATCTITNDDQAAHLKLVKQVVNDNGGTAGATDWTLSASGPTPISGAGGVDSDVDTGTYNLSESAGPSGYSTTGYDCGASVTLALGESKTCTITNNDIAPKLHLRKVVVNDNGGTATVASFTLTADGTGTNDLSGTSPVDSGSGLKADTWALSESGPSGYSQSSLDCVGGTQNGSNVTVGIGGEATCTFTNEDIAPKLHLRKVVVNDNGGTKTVADFTLTANGAGTNDLSGTSPVDSGAGLKADTWALSETNVYGYTAGAWVCVGGTQVNSNITVGIGGEATCTITNDDQPGTIIVKKIAKPANTGSFAFTTTGTGYNGFTLPGGGQNSQNLNAGSYTVKESTQLGWILTGIGGSSDPNTPYDCVVTGSGGSTGVGNLNTQTATISLKNGDTVTCTFENTGQGTTRTQGFWATHSPLANIAWFGGTAFGHTFPGVGSLLGNTSIDGAAPCPRLIDTLGKLMGGFWSDVSKTSVGGKRSALDQARMQLAQQLLAGELNTSAFGSVPSGGLSVFTTWENAFCGTNQNAIKNALQGAASFNSQGDNSTFTPGTSADSKNARSIANLVFWNLLP